jgi:hypothetical protein
MMGGDAPIRLRRCSERNRLDRQFLINAYECLVAFVASDESFRFCPSPSIGLRAQEVHHDVYESASL